MQTIPIFIAAAHRANARSFGAELIPFVASCPTCGKPRLQSGYTRESLLLLLRRAQEIEANCIACDSLWSITPGERAEIVKALVCS